MLSWPRKTLNSSVAFSGPGLHFAEPVEVVVHPSDTGLTFQVGDQSVQALAENVQQCQFRTQLGPAATIEHIMSAFSGLGITDARVEMSAGEMPAMDGSSLDYALEFNAAGLKEIGVAEHPEFDPVVFVDGEIRIEVKPGEGHWSYSFLTGDRWPHRQDAEVDLRSDRYIRDVAPARTFGFEEEVEQMQAAGLGQGLTLESALVVGHGSYVNPPRFEDEPVRHKLLDLIGDLALTGIPAQLLDVTAVRSGHRSNVATAVKVREILQGM
jgi:UDP-3-O-[3-hydroxymyristoyl] N-acetylglucosamine deacetylase